MYSCDSFLRPFCLFHFFLFLIFLKFPFFHILSLIFYSCDSFSRAFCVFRIFYFFLIVCSNSFLLFLGASSTAHLFYREHPFPSLIPCIHLFHCWLFWRVCIFLPLDSISSFASLFVLRLFVFMLYPSLFLVLFLLCPILLCH